MSLNNAIWRDENGVCHVQGKDKAEVFGLMGYAHGKDRGMQMILMRILGQGRAAELLDSSDELLRIDTFFRRMNWTGAVARELEKLTADAATVLESYCRGVNRAFSEKTPWECRLFGFKPEPWRGEDSILISRMIGYLTLAQSQGEMERLLIEMIQAGVDRGRLDELFPGILGGLDIDLVKKIKLQERLVSPESLWNIAAPVMMASNNWVVSGRKTASGKPVIANDPHLEINRLPNVWYEMALQTNGSYAMGGTMPGTPALLVGRNPDLAWTATYTFMDGTDSWIEKCRDGKYFREPDQWLDFSRRKEIINRKKKPPVTVIFYENNHGVLEGDPNQEGYYLATAWAPSFSGALTFNSIIDILDATTVSRGMDLLGRIETSWNFVLADKQGNIGYQMSGLMPKRRKGVSGFVPLPGWEEQNDWQGFESPDDLPRSYNPDCGYLVTANQNLNEFGRVEPITVGMGPYRSDRIATLLARENRITCEFMYKLHYDVHSTQAETFMAVLSPLLPDSEQAAILKNWNGDYTADSRGAFLFDGFYRQLYREVFGRHGFGPEAVDQIEKHTGIFNDFYIHFDRILLQEESAWFGGRTRAEIYREAAEKALASPPEKWGTGRRVLMKNIVFDGKLPAFLGFDRGPITIIGSLATPHQGQIFESAGRLTTFAPSFRMVTDMATDEIHTNLAGGPSDRRFSKWYCSDLENWKNGKYKTIDLRPERTRLEFV
ncbi:MAG: penicillin acylase family protein [Thermodesulfobacteriota bacterium]